MWFFQRLLENSWAAKQTKSVVMITHARICTDIKALINT